MTERSLPFQGTTRDVASESDQRAYYSHLGNGIINARTLDSGKLVADGTSVLSLNPVDVKIQGLLYQLTTTPKAFNLASIGTQPAAGQSRIDLLVWRLNTTAKTITAEVVSGLPATNPAVPALSRAGAVYEEYAWQWRWSGVGLQQAALVDHRSWIGPRYVLADDADLPAAPDIGTAAHRRRQDWLFRPTAGVPQWVNLTIPRLRDLTAFGGAPNSNVTTTVQPGGISKLIAVRLDGAQQPPEGLLNVSLATKVVTTGSTAGNVWCQTSATGSTRYGTKRWHASSSNSAVVTFDMRAPASGGDLIVEVWGSVDGGTAATVAYGEPRISIQSESVGGG